MVDGDEESLSLVPAGLARAQLQPVGGLALQSGSASTTAPTRSVRNRWMNSASCGALSCHGLSEVSSAMPRS